MDVRYLTNPEDFKTYTTDKIREEFLIKNIFREDDITLTYSHQDRMIVGGIYPINKDISLPSGEELGVDYFLERREMGVVNIGGKGTVVVDGEEYPMVKLDGLYIGMGVKEVVFKSDNPQDPAKFYIASAPAHTSYPTKKIDIKDAEPLHLGSLSESNERTIYKYIHPEGVKSCQLVMGITILEKNNVWNTMPTHTHERRMEVYFYFDIPDNNVVFHFMGRPEETRHIVIRNQEAIISPSWSIHSGVGTRNYAFIWSMAGENQTFSDMDGVKMEDLK